MKKVWNTHPLFSDAIQTQCQTGILFSVLLKMARKIRTVNVQQQEGRPAKNHKVTTINRAFKRQTEIGTNYKTCFEVNSV